MTYDYETFAGEISTRYSSAHGLEVVTCGFHCRAADVRAFLAAMREVWPVKVPMSCANEFADFPAECWMVAD